MIKDVGGLHVKYPLFLPDVNERRIFSTNYSHAKFHENPSRHDEPNSRFSQFCERTLKSANILLENASDMSWNNDYLFTQFHSKSRL
jgi:hypothetical protein